MNLFTTIKHQLYLLQLENYELPRYWKLLFAKGFFPTNSLRKELEWTSKTKVLAFVAFIMHILSSIFAAHFFMNDSIVWIIIYLGVGLFLYPLFYSLGIVVLWPLDSFLKNCIVRKARNKIRQMPNLKIIGVAGSYGKTTMKNVLSDVLSEQFKVATPTEGVNTPVGIARWILNSLHAEHEIFVVEMGEHYRGDIAYLCSITPPDVAIITGINEAHLERFGSLAAIGKTIFEIVTGSKPSAMFLLNGDDKNIREFYKAQIGIKDSVVWYSSKLANKQSHFDQENLSWNAAIDGNEISIPFLGEYSVGIAAVCLHVGKYLNADPKKIVRALARVKPAEHRLQPIRSSQNVLVIDDSYNGNPDGVAEAIKVMARFSGKRKIFLTPGLVETGMQAHAIHETIGEQLALAADIVILIKNSVTPYIEKGMGSNASKIIWFNTAQEAHAALPAIIKAGDVIVFQNDWGDQYV